MNLRIFGWPALLAALTLAGLFAGLLGDGAVDWIATAALAAPLAVLAWAWRARRC